jgi:UDP-N-acetylglucosamine 2-epimerase (non-hydrolysing)
VTSKKLRLLLVAGARPNFMKIAPILRAADAAGQESILVHTGQHYDAQMSDAFFTDLHMRKPDHHLGAGSGSHAQQTARIMAAFEPVLIETRPDWLVVVGDVNSTLACALTASKLAPSLGCRIAHVEAGLRSGDWTMPEEVNRVLTDRLSDLLLLPSEDALPNLIAEGIPAEKTVMVGNVMIDTLFDQLPAARATGILERNGVERGKYVLVTLHRPSNVDTPAMLDGLLAGIEAVSQEMPVVFPIHPRTRKTVDESGLSSRLTRVKTIAPLGYTEMLGLTDGAAVILTDSGGLQEESTALGVPCVTLREQTERPVTVTHGTNRMAQWPPTRDSILRDFRVALKQGRVAPGERCPSGWDGKAAERVVAALVDRR